VLHALMHDLTTQTPDVAKALSDAHATFDLLVECIEQDFEAVPGIEDGIITKLAGFYPQAA
jgi:hypothetical protein